ncbi:MAG: hypothetical protein ACXWW0_13735, partial [Bacteroidia bacterium]
MSKYFFFRRHLFFSATCNKNTAFYNKNAGAKSLCNNWQKIKKPGAMPRAMILRPFRAEMKSLSVEKNIQSFNHSIIQSFNHSIIQSFNHSIIQSF